MSKKCTSGGFSCETRCLVPESSLHHQPEGQLPSSRSPICSEQFLKRKGTYSSLSHRALLGVTAPKPCDHLAPPTAHLLGDIRVFPVLGVPRGYFDPLHFQGRMSTVFPSKTPNEGDINSNGWGSGSLVSVSQLCARRNGGAGGL